MGIAEGKSNSARSEKPELKREKRGTRGEKRTIVLRAIRESSTDAFTACTLGAYARNAAAVVHIIILVKCWTLGGERERVRVYFTQYGSTVYIGMAMGCSAL